MNVIAVFQPAEPRLGYAVGRGYAKVYRFWLKVGLLTCLAGPCLAVAVAPETSDGDWSQLVSVRELLQLDTERALARARTGRSGRDSGVPEVMPASSQQLELLAIYGVGTRLLAEVQVGHDRYVYLRGQALPVGGNRSLPEHAHRLVAIEGACVRMAFQSTEKTACLGQAVQGVQR